MSIDLFATIVLILILIAMILLDIYRAGMDSGFNSGLDSSDDKSMYNAKLLECMEEKGMLTGAKYKDAQREASESYISFQKSLKDFEGMVKQ